MRANCKSTMKNESFDLSTCVLCGCGGGGVGMNGWMDGWVDTTTGSRFVCKDGGIAAMWNGATDRVGEIGRRCLGAV
jgi:hypothetical protein